MPNLVLQPQQPHRAAPRTRTRTEICGEIALVYMFMLVLHFGLVCLGPLSLYCFHVRLHARTVDSLQWNNRDMKYERTNFLSCLAHTLRIIGTLAQFSANVLFEVHDTIFTFYRDIFTDMSLVEQFQCGLANEKPPLPDLNSPHAR